VTQHWPGTRLGKSSVLHNLILPNDSADGTRLGKSSVLHNLILANDFADSEAVSAFA